MQHEIKEKTEEQIIKERKEKLLKFLVEKKKYLYWIGFLIVLIIGCWIRTRNLNLLIDATTGKHTPLALDPYLFLRYARYIVEHGSLMQFDAMRYWPFGFLPANELTAVSYIVAYIYKFLHSIGIGVTLEYIDVIYPVIFFAIGLLFFYLFVKKLFNENVALLASALLAVNPAYLYRTMAGFADKEAAGLAAMFLSLYLWTYALETKNLKKAILFGLGAGFGMFLMALCWGGVGYLFLIFGLFGFAGIFIERFKKRETMAFLSLGIFVTVLIWGFKASRYSINKLLTSTTFAPLYVALLFALTYLIFKYTKLNKSIKNIKLPESITCLIILAIVAIVGSSVMFGPSFLIEKIKYVINLAIHPFGGTRWTLTVAENRQPYVTDWFGSFGPSITGVLITLLFLVGVGLMFYKLVEHFPKKEKWQLTTAFSIFLLAFVFSRYSPNSVLNGETSIAKFLFMGSIIVFPIYLIYVYVTKYRETHSHFKEIDLKLLFALIFSFVLLFGARGAIRLILMLTLAVCVGASYLLCYLAEYLAEKLKNFKISWSYALVMGFVFVILFLPAAKSSLAQARFTGPSYNLQWQISMKWVRENTPSNAIFAHWWDYGYWVQTGGNRTTITDGGNVYYSLNYFMGRHVLTGHSEEEALEFLYAHNATHLLIISDDIGKYPAYSSIGSDENYDRYSWLPVFVLDPRSIQEKRNYTSYVYYGNTAVDHDIVYNNTLFPRKMAGIGAFLLRIKQKNNSISLLQPEGVFVYMHQQYKLPIKCIVFQGKRYEFADGIDACLVVIPSIANNNINPLGALIYVSPEVKKTNFARLYLFNESKYFKLVYSDEQQIPLALYNGALRGPLKIWEINYPENITFKEVYLSKEVPNPAVLVPKEV